MTQRKTIQKSNPTEKSISLEDTVIYKEIQKRNIRVLITAIVLLAIGITSLIPVVFDRSLFFLIVASIFLLISIYQFILIFRRNENIYHHPDMNHFLQWGEEYGNYVIAMDEELKQNKKTEYSHTFFTDSFVFVPNFYKFEWFHSSEVCWAFNHVTKHSVNFIPTGKTYEVHIYVDDGSLVKFESNKKESEEILNHLLAISPFAYFGYTDELKKAWNKDTVNFIKSVKHRMELFFTNPDKFIEDNFNSSNEYSNFDSGSEVDNSDFEDENVCFGTYEAEHEECSQCYEAENCKNKTLELDIK